MNDLRLPIGVFFLLLGGLLATTPSGGAPMTNSPVNLYVGLCSLAFGGLMVWLARRA
jgi:hypothetical protein